MTEDYQTLSKLFKQFSNNLFFFKTIILKHCRKHVKNQMDSMLSSLNSSQYEWYPIWCYHIHCLWSLLILLLYGKTSSWTILYLLYLSINECWYFFFFFVGTLVLYYSSVNCLKTTISTYVIHPPKTCIV